MKKDCWVCKQKKDWKSEQLKAIRATAKQKANEQNETMAIIKEGCIYRVIKASDLEDLNGAEFVSKYS